MQGALTCNRMLDVISMLDLGWTWEPPLTCRGARLGCPEEGALGGSLARLGHRRRLGGHVIVLIARQLLGDAQGLHHRIVVVTLGLALGSQKKGGSEIWG